MTLIFCVSALLLAVVTPQNPNARVHDFAGLLSVDQRAALEQIAADVEKQTTAQLAVVTVESLDGKTVEDYANELFNKWGIGQTDINNGVLLLVAPQQRRMRIEVGRGLESLLTDALCGQIRDTIIIPQFKEGDFAGGIVAGTEELARVLKSDRDAAPRSQNSGPMLAEDELAVDIVAGDVELAPELESFDAAHIALNSRPAPDKAPQRNSLVAAGSVGIAALVLTVFGFTCSARRLYSRTAFIAISGGSLIVLAVAASMAFQATKLHQTLAPFGGAAAVLLGAWGFNLLKYRRFGPRGCSRCGMPLELLSEQQEEPKLSSLQRLEENIGSVDYDVWICATCLNSDTERYVKGFSGFQDCVACKARAFKLSPQEVLVPATTVSVGRARIEGRCVSCNHKTVQNILLPMLPQPSSTNSFTSSSFSGGGGGSGGSGFAGGSSGGGKFGGGSSRGGGASGSW